ncbi:hypothetical protein [Leclercia sp. W17]|uniref:hypothetical protein n=1 Tax=Leclercia sp. W17 TaxID=2282309 RepID=UPI000DF238E1|nr:hypothetical protein [Leclercia sp. W17]AXF64991.1 hypothetical protein DVA44_13210 [Leclercia sp. W17]
MAGEEIAGSIVYEVGAEVEPLLQGGRQVNKVLTEIENALDDNIAQFKKMDTQVSATAQAVNQSVRSFSGFQNALRQGGYQVQDFIVQVQGGQSALVALSQQGSQLLGVFGTGGAVAGALLTLGTVIVGSLIAGMDNATISTKALTEAQKRLSDIFQISSNGVVVLSDKFAKLAETSENAARAQLTMALIDANNIIKASVQSVNQLGDALGTWKAPLSAAISQMDALKARGMDVNQALKELGGTYEGNIIGLNQLNQAVNNISESFGISTDDAIKLVQALGAVRQNASPETIAALRDVTVELSQKYGYANKSLSEFTGKVGEYSLKSDQAKESTRLATEMLQGHKVASEADAEAIAQNTQRLQTYIQMIKDEGATIAMTARQKALYRAEQLGASDEDKRAINTSFDKIEAFKAEQIAQKESAKEARKSATTAATQAKKLESQADRNANILEEYRQKASLSADSTADLSREQAILAARQKLTNPTPQQIAQIERDAAAAWDKAAALKAQNAVPILKENADYTAQRKALENLKGQKDANGQLILSQEQYNQASEKLEQDHQTNLAKIRAQQAVTPQQEAAGGVDPVQQLANQHAQQLALIQQYEQQGVLTHQNALALKTAADTQYEQQRTAAQWELLSQQSLGYEMLTSAVDAFAGNASNALTGLITGSMSAQEAMRSLGSTVLNSVVNSLVQVGVEALKNFIIGQTMGTAASAASIGQAAAVGSAWAPAAAMASLATLGANAAPASAGITSTVGLASGLAVAGMRKNGGPVSAGSMYQVGEGGMPEIYRASTGKQYMIPGDNGRVISNKDMQGGGGIQVIFNVQNTTPATFDAQVTNNGNNSVTIDAIIADLNNGGPISDSITSNTTAKRTPRGQR